jgi:hypothetical protein
MKSRAVRLTLFLLFVVAAGTTAYLFYQGETRMRAETESARAFQSRVFEIIRDVDHLRAAQQAYVAAGQGDQFWANKVTASVAELQGKIDGLRAQATSTPAQAAMDNARAIVEDFSQMDRRAREYARNGQRLLASDLIFSDGLELTTAAAEALAEAGLAERRVRDELLAGIRGRQLYALGAATAAALLVTLLLLPAGRADEPETERASTSLLPRPEAEQFAAPAVPANDLTLEEGWSRAAIAEASDAPVATAAVVEAVRVETAPAPLAAAPPLELAPLASLCTDLARLSDTRALPGLLERAATALDASGIILWIADPDGQELAPIVTHGYAPNLVTRLGNIRRDEQNATAAALRTSLLQTVKADTVSEGAIAAPLVTPAGCVGVMAAEVRHAGEEDSTRLAVATIVAAQLATLVGPPSTKARAEAAG